VRQHLVRETPRSFEATGVEEELADAPFGGAPIEFLGALRGRADKK